MKTINLNLKTTANALELGASVVKRIMGDGVSGTVDGNLYTTKDIQLAIAARIKANALKGAVK